MTMPTQFGLRPTPRPPDLQQIQREIRNMQLSLLPRTQQVAASQQPGRPRSDGQLLERHALGAVGGAGRCEAI